MSNAEDGDTVPGASDVHRRRPGVLLRRPLKLQMRRETFRTAVVVSTVGVLSVLSASAGPVRFWDTPVETSQGVGETADVDTAELPTPTDDSPQVPDSSVGGDSSVVAPVLVLILAGLVFIGGWSEPSTSTLSGRWRRRRRRSAGEDRLVDTTDVAALVIDVEPASRALLEGRPGDAIVACWIQLERTAIDAGIPSDPGETPSQYVERVVSVRSIDRGPISDLADLYREARFSAHDLTDSDRDRAAVALQSISDAFAGDHEVTT